MTKVAFINAKNLVFRVIGLILLLFLAFKVYDRFFAWPHQKEQFLSRNGKVSIEVYYEVLCPDSRHFLLKQLYPTWEKVNDIMDIHFKPYGKATHKLVNNNYEFKCQHGPTECEGNTVHACAVHHIKDAHLLVKYINCMIEDNYDPIQRGQSCSSSLDVNFTPIQRCVSNREGPALLAAIGDDTHSLRPKVSFIPTILLNGSQDGQKLILKDLLLEVCRKFQGQKPKNCIKIL